jgi:hypothetical protein
MPTILPIIPPAPVPANQLLALLFIGAMAKQGFTLDQAAKFMPGPLAEIDEQRRELERAEAEAKKSKRTRKE